jgi:hypothetical protein
MEKENPVVDEGATTPAQETSVFSGHVFGDKTFSLRHILVVVFLLALHWAMAISSVVQKNDTVDESAHLTSGVANWKYNDYRLNPEGGTIAQRWAAIPVVLGNYKFLSLTDPCWGFGEVYIAGRQFFYFLGNDLEQMLLEARAMITCLSVVLGLLVFFWSRQLFGTIGGLLSLGVYAFSPTMLAHARLVTADLCATLFFWLTIGCLWLVMHRLTLFTLMGLSLAATGLVLSKMSGVLILPVALVLLVARIAVSRPLVVGLSSGRVAVAARRRAQAGILLTAMIVCGFLTWGGVWAGYGCRYSMASETGNSDSSTHCDWESVETDSLVFNTIQWIRKHQLLPEAYLCGFAFTQKSMFIRKSFLNGEVGLTGWRSFFPYAFLYKTPLATMLFWMFSLAAVFYHWRSQRNELDRGSWRKMGSDLYAMTPLLVFVGIYGGMAITSRVNIGHRHILPIYPAVFIVIGAAGFWLAKPWRIPKTVVLITLATLVMESATIWPHYLEYFNVLSGGPDQGYRRLVDSSLDWGQDLPVLRNWIEEKGLDKPGTEPLYLSYFGTALPGYFGIKSRWLPGFPLDLHRAGKPLKFFPGFYCISATMLQSVYLPPMGPWCAPYEASYAQVSEEIDRLLVSAPGSEARRAVVDEHGLPYWRDLFVRYNVLRFQRLCAYLRHREPDDRIAYSFLVYHLGSDEIHQALHGPPAELFEKPQIKGLDAGQHSIDE